ncbi:MAG: endonuclease III [Methanotrichaceae archaeon]|nr:endonuclease III [Methanotrichaceae archaeon]
MIQEKAEIIIELLEGLYGQPVAKHMNPLDLLVCTILSQNTTDVNSIRAFNRLKEAYPYYEALLYAPNHEICEKIRVGGLGEIKTHRIKEALKKVKKDFGSIDLESLRSKDKDSAKEYLLSLPGVGPKTASVVMLFSLQLLAMPVDTHVYRVSRRLGIIPDKSSIKVAQEILERITPPSKYLSLHINLIRHGRKICRARNPLHNQCNLQDICDYYRGATSLK